MNEQLKEKLNTLLWVANCLMDIVQDATISPEESKTEYYQYVMKTQIAVLRKSLQSVEENLPCKEQVK